ncbi:MAG TPA: hypothetical protein VLG28_00745 [Acidimicrobiia bacterium]|nr:hypothetical protein [Acidimicrobiia bacterium]
MDERRRLASEQLSRMRGMTVEYHRRFFSDIRVAIVVISALFVAGFWEVPEAFLLIPVVALYTAVQTAFDASYLIFARHYAAALETDLNRQLGTRLHVGGELENTYLFPLNERKIVTAAAGSGFSWFGFVTLFYTLLGLGAGLFGLALGWTSVLTDAAPGWQWGYLGSLGLLAFAALATGFWWFVGGAGEARLHRVLEDFPREM